MVSGVADAVDDRVAQPDVGGGHVNFGAQGAGAVGEFAVFHALEEVEVFRDGTVAERAVLAGTVRGAAVLVGVLGGEVAGVGQAFFDEGHGVLVKLVEIVGGVERLKDCGLRIAGCGLPDGSEIEIGFAVASDGAGGFALGLEAEGVAGPAANEPVDVPWIESTYSTFSLAGLVSSMRRLQTPPNSRAMPKFRQMDLAWPMWSQPLGSGGNRV